VYQSSNYNHSGWGDGFLNNTLKSPAFGINHGVSGASLVSIAQYKAKHEVFVTIQFGHNDQKNPAYEQAFSANLKQFVADVNAAGGVPVSNFFEVYIL
jgi:lysophospholipase L1-like esterase